MIIRRAEDIRPSEITPYGTYLNRRQLIGAGTALSLGVKWTWSGRDAMSANDPKRTFCAITSEDTGIASVSSARQIP